MCGIFGIINHSGKYIQKGEALVRELFFGTQLRGTDAFGLGIVTGTGEVDWVKIAGVGLSGFIHHKDVSPMLKKIETNKAFVIGHNRHATIGDKDNNEHAHPHVYGSTMLVHNGTLSWWEGKHDKENKDETDSMGATRLIDTHGIEAAVKKIRGAYVFVTYDEVAKKLRIIRNHERPLGIVHTEDFSIFASEPSLAFWILDRNKIKITGVDVIEEGHIYEWGFKQKDALKKKIDITQTMPTYSGNPSYSNYHNWLDGREDDDYIVARRSKSLGQQSSPQKTEESPKKATVTELRPLTTETRRKPKVVMGTKGQVREYEGHLVGDTFEFHIDTYERKGASQFCSFTGRIFGDPYHVAKVSGNVNMPIAELDTNKFLFTGKITSMNFRGESVTIQVGNVSVSNTVDPDKEIKDTEEETMQTGGKAVAQLPVPFRSNEWSGRTVRCDTCGSVVPEETTQSRDDIKYNVSTGLIEKTTVNECRACQVAFEAQVAGHMVH